MEPAEPISSSESRVKPSFFARIGPGLLVAATGVGAGDLATGALAGSEVGVAVLWAVLAGALMKFTLNEGLARWQLSTGTTFLEGAARHFRIFTAVLFLPYLLIWSFFVGSALMSACGATFHAMAPFFDDAVTGKRVFGIAHSAAGVAIVLAGGFRVFRIVMQWCIGIMFVTVVITAGLLWPGNAEIWPSLFLPNLSTLRGENLTWTIALMGGVGGTVTILCYGYWIRESGWLGEADLRRSRIDLGVAYGMTAIFGLAMVIIGSTVTVQGTGAGLIVNLAGRLEESLGAVGKWAFLLGAWGAVFSSLLGVWQAVPYLFADLCQSLGNSSAPAGRPAVQTDSLPYRAYLFFMATVPAIGLFYAFKSVQKAYAIMGAAFIPLLALGLLVLNGRQDWIGARMRNGWLAVAALAAALIFFVWFGWMEAMGRV